MQKLLNLIFALALAYIAWSNYKTQNVAELDMNQTACLKELQRIVGK